MRTGVIEWARREGGEMNRRATAPGVIGRALPRIEDPPLLTGRGAFVADIDFPHQLHMRVVRSPYAHAVLRGVDVAMARGAPGVAAVDGGGYRRSAAD
jgi:CO/xanthine dehydrogenase Mo-binding subunit